MTRGNGFEDAKVIIDFSLKWCFMTIFRHLKFKKMKWASSVFTNFCFFFLKQKWAFTKKKQVLSYLIK